MAGCPSAESDGNPTSDQRAAFSAVVQRHVLPCAALGAIAYIPHYLDEHTAKEVLRHVHASPAALWNQVSGRRVQNHGGIVHTKGLLQSALPAWLKGVTQRVQDDTAAFDGAPPNHVLVNAYQPGQGIMVGTASYMPSSHVSHTSLRHIIMTHWTEGVCTAIQRCRIYMMRV
jgi:hypothetical protein